MTALRLGAVSYLNARPLVCGLEERGDLFSVRFDVPARCAALLHEGAVDLGLIPAIEYLAADYAVVPGVAIASNGPIDSVAVFSRVPIDRVRTLALDTSSRTSVALTRVLCARRWGIRPAFDAAEPDLPAMLDRADAALVIGDRAFAADAAALGVLKYDLGLEWQALTGLPFVYAMWVGRPGAATSEHGAALRAARDRGVAEVDRIARDEAGGDAAREARVRRYLRDTLRYGLGEAELEGLRRFFDLAAAMGAAPAARPIRFHD